jgi:prevent-host-death family protein
VTLRFPLNASTHTRSNSACDHVRTACRSGFAPTIAPTDAGRAVPTVDPRKPPVIVGASLREFLRLVEMCHNVHMKTISIRELHLKTGRWVRHAASRGPIVVTDRGRRVAALQPFDASVTRRPLPNREAAIRKRSKIPVDSAVYVSELREGR